jgi:hypothetical protein
MISFSGQLRCLQFSAWRAIFTAAAATPRLPKGPLAVGSSGTVGMGDTNCTGPSGSMRRNIVRRRLPAGQLTSLAVCSCCCTTAAQELPPLTVCQVRVADPHLGGPLAFALHLPIIPSTVSGSHSSVSVSGNSRPKAFSYPSVTDDCSGASVKANAIPCHNADSAYSACSIRARAQPDRLPCLQSHFSQKETTPRAHVDQRTAAPRSRPSRSVCAAGWASCSEISMTVLDIDENSSQDLAPRPAAR